MKFVSSFLSFVFPAIALAAQFEVIGPCSEKPVYKFDVADKFETVADLTFYVLDKNKIHYKGTEKGIISMIGTPEGLDAMEVLSDTQMRAYGWCYFVNGKVSMAYADETYLRPGDKVQWIYSYADFDRDWKTMCNPGYLIKSAQFCKKK